MFQSLVKIEVVMKFETDKEVTLKTWNLGCNYNAIITIETMMSIENIKHENIINLLMKLLAPSLSRW